MKLTSEITEEKRTKEEKIFDITKPPKTYITAGDRHLIERTDVFHVNIHNILGTFIISIGSAFLGACLTANDSTIKDSYGIISIILFIVGIILYGISLYYMLYKWEKEKKLVKM